MASNQPTRSSNTNSSSFTYSASSFSSSSYSSSTNGQQTTGQRHAQSSYTDPSGTTVNKASQNMGEPVVLESRRYDAEGRAALEGGAGGATGRRIEDVSDDEKAQADTNKAYEERMEDEYAKREGGA